VKFCGLRKIVDPRCEIGKSDILTTSALHLPVLLSKCNLVLCSLLIYLWLPYGIRQAIIFSSCGFFYLSFIFYLFVLACSQPSQIGCLPYFHTWCGLSGNLGCRSETCCTGLAENTGRKKSPKIRNLGTIAQLCWATSLQQRHISTIRKKDVLNSNISSTCPHNMVNLRLTGS